LITELFFDAPAGAAGCDEAFATPQGFKGKVNGNRLLTDAAELRQKGVTVGKKA
jgi:hypothetical protein